MTDDILRPQQNPVFATEHFLCRFDEIDDGASKEIILDEQRTSFCLVRLDGKIYAYLNSCPHTGAPLNWTSNQFLSLDGNMIQCAVHGALFRITDGVCIWGPCLHQQLKSVPTVVRDGSILLAIRD